MFENLELKLSKNEEEKSANIISILTNYLDSIYRLKCENGTLYLSFEKEDEIEKLIFIKMFKDNFNGLNEYIEWKKINIGNEETLLKIDIDSKRLDLLYDLANKLKELKTHLKIYWIDIRETTKGLHVRIKVSGIKNCLEIVFLQLLLNSDKTREALNYVRAKKLKDIKRFEKFNMLFTIKMKNGKIYSVEKYREDLTKKIWSMVK